MLTVAVSNRPLRRGLRFAQRERETPDGFSFTLSLPSERLKFTATCVLRFFRLVALPINGNDFTRLPLEKSLNTPEYESGF